jgi:hypothetical protein
MVRAYRGLLRLYTRYGPPDRSTAEGGLCLKASARPVTQQSRSSATRPIDNYLGGTSLHRCYAPSGRTEKTGLGTGQLAVGLSRSRPIFERRLLSVAAIKPLPDRHRCTTEVWPLHELAFRGESLGAEIGRNRGGRLSDVGNWPAFSLWRQLVNIVRNASPAALSIQKLGLGAVVCGHVNLMV